MSNAISLAAIKQNMGLFSGEVTLPTSDESLHGNPYTDVTIYYISDLHLGHHGISPDIEFTLKHQRMLSIVRSLCLSVNTYKSLIIFSGDIADCIDDVGLFFKLFCLRLNVYQHYLYWKQNKLLNRSKQESCNLKAKYQKMKDKLTYISQDIDVKTIRATKRYIKSTLFTYYDLCKNEKIKIRNKWKEQHPEVNDPVFWLIYDILKIEKKLMFIKQQKNNTEWQSFKNSRKVYPVIYVLGNHELTSYFSLDCAYSEYKERLLLYGVKVLCNESVTYTMKRGNTTNKIRILGGVGFAKYNPNYNCETLCGITGMNREQEIAESDIFFSLYNEEIKSIRRDNLLCIVVTHYPPTDWMPSGCLSDRCIYVYGHNHHNHAESIGNSVLLANNQIGYGTDMPFSFKRFATGTCLNPFYEYENGAHEITIQQYCQFYAFLGQFDMSLKRVEQALEKDGAKLWVIKYSGYYGYFITTPGRKTKILNKGSFVNASNNDDINFFNDSFRNVVAAIYIASQPYRQEQEYVSQCIRDIYQKWHECYWGSSEEAVLNYSVGSIHGAIVDVDFYHHIMLNPIDNTLYFYYSPIMGVREYYPSVLELFEHKAQELGLPQGCAVMETVHTQLSQSISNTMPINDANQVSILGHSYSVRTDTPKDEPFYAVSMRMAKMQKIFERNVLTVWSDEIASTALEKRLSILPSIQASHSTCPDVENQDKRLDNVDG